ncbi:K(+)-transporting ATPase subunit F [Anoxybacterium hadale]|uniref:K(+)-transporting ATPase subunit F n=1 Tax=Anoxybacterium hadale TaxID=3408580 RepID=A0ACD1AAT0_9FIRM|nr:K(+)-transporting ATPase subunit F [Clostridiales bacterium]
MNFILAVSACLAVGLLVYLFYVLFRGENL